MSFVEGLVCLRCGRRYAEKPGRYVCDCVSNHASDIGVLDVEYDYAGIQRALAKDQSEHCPYNDLRDFVPLLPIAGADSLPPMPVGGTPLLPAPRLASRLGIGTLYVKDDGRNPTGSLKDRASAIAVARALEEGAERLATASTGNAAAALAGMCASAGLPCTIFVPESAPPAKLAQLLVYGAQVLPIRGSYDQAFDLCTEACEEYGWYNRNTGYNPYMSEGKKTVSFEFAHQLYTMFSSGTDFGFQSPENVFVSVGDGCIVGGVYKGFYDLVQLGWIDHIPRIFGVQSEKSDALYQAWRHGKEVPEPVIASTRADSISVNAPRDAVKALRAVRESGGQFIRVSDAAIMAAIPKLAQDVAVFAEPAGATSLAGLESAVQLGIIDKNDCTVIINTGSGLKDVQAVMEVTGAVESIEPSMEAVRESLQR